MRDVHSAEGAHPTTMELYSRDRAPSLLPSKLTGLWAVPRRRLIVVLSLILWDVLLALVMWQVAFVLQAFVGQAILGYGPVSTITLVSMVPNIVAWIGLRASMGLYPGYGLDQVEELRRQTMAMLATFTIILVFAFVSHLGDTLSRLFLLAWALGLLIAAPAARYFAKAMIRKSGRWGKSVVLLGDNETGVEIASVLQKEWQLGFRPVCFFDNHTAELAAEAEPYLETLDAAAILADEYGVDTVVFTMQETEPAHLVKLVGRASTSFRYVIVMPNLAGITNSAVIARDFAGNFAVEIKQTLLFPWARRTKHALDILLTLGGGLLISPLLIAIVILIKLESPGPVFYGHRRVGAAGKHFRCWKFRTMYTNAEQLLDQFLQGNPHLRAEWEQTFKLRNDPRVTRVGRLLRKTSLDELPQLWNVLLGQMSLVGPRPIVDAEIPKYGDVYNLYLRIRPGISGFWQVSGRSNTSYAERVKLDAYYVHNWSVWLDLVILVRTMGSVLRGRGAY